MIGDLRVVSNLRRWVLPGVVLVVLTVNLCHENRGTHRDRAHAANSDVRLVRSIPIIGHAYREWESINVVLLGGQHTCVTGVKGAQLFDEEYDRVAAACLQISVLIDRLHRQCVWDAKIPVVGDA